ncbi:MAG: heavy metal-associated domain-containing protein [Bacteroidota bacterium]
MDATTETLAIDGMSCTHCVAAVRAALESVPGTTVRTVEIGSATVDLAPEANRAALHEAIEDAGFDLAST